MEKELLSVINQKIDLLIEAHKNKNLKSSHKYLTSIQVAEMVGLSSRTILNRSNLPVSDPRFIPSVKFGSRKKLFERVVIDRMFEPQTFKEG